MASTAVTALNDPSDFYMSWEQPSGDRCECVYVQCYCLRCSSGNYFPRTDDCMYANPQRHHEPLPR